MCVVCVNKCAIVIIAETRQGASGGVLPRCLMTRAAEEVGTGIIKNMLMYF